MTLDRDADRQCGRAALLEALGVLLQLLLGHLLERLQVRGREGEAFQRGFTVFVQPIPKVLVGQRSADDLRESLADVCWCLGATCHCCSPSRSL